MIKNISLQVLFFFILFHLISWVRELSLLESDTHAPNFSLVSVAGENVGTLMTTRDFQGKPTVLFFWAPWCSVCKVSMPNLQAFHQDNFDQVNVVSIVMDYESVESVTDYMQNNQLSFTTLLGKDSTAIDYKIQGFPTYYVLDANGQIHAKSMGYSSEIGMKARTLTL